MSQHSLLAADKCFDNDQRSVNSKEIFHDGAPSVCLVKAFESGALSLYAAPIPANQSWVGSGFGVSVSRIVAFTGDVVCAFAISNEQ
jgi:hypothetical protein